MSSNHNLSEHATSLVNYLDRGAVSPTWSELEALSVASRADFHDGLRPTSTAATSRPPAGATHTNARCVGTGAAGAPLTADGNAGGAVHVDGPSGVWSG